MTEIEKDKALERHLKKLNNQMELKNKLDKPRDAAGIGFEKKPIMERPKKPETSDDYLAVKLWKIILSGILAVVATVAPFIVKHILTNMGVELEPMFYFIPSLALGIILLVVAVTLICQKIFERDKVKEYKDAIRKYEDKVAIYENKKEEYKKLKETLKEEGKAFYENQNGIYEAD